MPQERYANNATTTLTSGVNNSSDPVTVAVASATAFPANGNFRILIGTEILKVTSVSGSNFTASRAQEGTTIASHSSSDPVKLIFTADALDQTIKDRATVGTAANYAADNNIHYQANDVPVATFKQGYSAVSPYVPIHTWDVTTWTWFNQGSASIVKNNDFCATMTAPHTSGEHLRGLHVATVGDFTIDAWVYPQLYLNGGGFTLAGINVGNGSNDKKYRIAFMNNISTDFSVISQYWTDNDTPSSTLGQLFLPPTLPYCLRMVYSSGGNTISSYYSIDGINFVGVSVATSVSSNFTPNRAGIHIEHQLGSAPLSDPVTLFSNVWIR